jgi:hypothetical protein
VTLPNGDEDCASALPAVNSATITPAPARRKEWQVA